MVALRDSGLTWAAVAEAAGYATASGARKAYQRLAAQGSDTDQGTSSAMPPVALGAMRQAFDETARTSVQLDLELDAAVIAAGRAIADRIDAATLTGDGQEVTKALYLVPHLLNILREMLATPAARGAITAVAQAATVPTKLETLAAGIPRPDAATFGRSRGARR